MFRSLKVREYRGLSEFSLKQLGRINLLVGANNCGKTSILECIQLLSSRGDLGGLDQITKRRGEVTFSQEGLLARLADVSHVFPGHECVVGKSLSVTTETDDGERTFLMEVIPRSPQPNLFPDDDDNDGVGSSDLAISLEWLPTAGAGALVVPLTHQGGALLRRSREPREPCHSISTAGLTVHQVIEMFEQIVLSPDEDLVIAALKAVDPLIERIATVRGDHRAKTRGGIVVRRQGSESRIPIGSLGDGMWRMLGMAIGVVMSKNGILLVDEIDTGLHYSVLDKMWHLLLEASRNLNVQIFATTHSRDCVESVATIAHGNHTENSEVMIHRIEAGQVESVPYSEAEIVAAAESGIEVR